MSQVYEHNPNDHEDPEAGSTWLVAVIGTVVFVATVLLLVAVYYNSARAEEAVKVVERKPVQYEAVRAQQQGHLESYFKVADEDDRYIIPIEQAMDIVTKDLSRSQQQSRAR